MRSNQEHAIAQQQHEVVNVILNRQRHVGELVLVALVHR